MVRYVTARVHLKKCFPDEQTKKQHIMQHLVIQVDLSALLNMIDFGKAPMIA